MTADGSTGETGRASMDVEQSGALLGGPLRPPLQQLQRERVVWCVVSVVLVIITALIASRRPSQGLCNQPLSSPPPPPPRFTCTQQDDTCRTLGAFFVSSNGAAWTQTRGWASAAAGVATSYCAFFGASCTPGGVLSSRD